MTPRRRLFIGVVIAAALLVGGRTLSALYADYTWYAAMGATPLWSERAGDLLLIYGIGTVIAVSVAFVNLSALSRSIGILMLPGASRTCSLARQFRGSIWIGSRSRCRSRSRQLSLQRCRAGPRWRSPALE